MKTTLPLALLLVCILAAGVFSAARGAPSSVAPSPAAPAATSSPAAATSTSYTLQEVAQHADASSCWTAINGSVYDLTGWIAQHPGGPEHILSICGKDGTSAFEGQHSADPRPNAILATFKIGALSS